MSYNFNLLVASGQQHGKKLTSQQEQLTPTKEEAEPMLHNEVRGGMHLSPRLYTETFFGAVLSNFDRKMDKCSRCRLRRVVVIRGSRLLSRRAKSHHLDQKRC